MIAILIASLGGIIVFSFFATIIGRRFIAKSKPKQLSEYEKLRQKYIETGDTSVLMQMKMMDNIEGGN